MPTYTAVSFDTFNYYKAKFRDKKTGEEFLTVNVFIVPQPGKNFDSVFDACCAREHCCRFGVKGAYLLDKDGNYIVPPENDVLSFDHFDDPDFDPIQALLDTGLYTKRDVKNLEFLGFGCEKDFFEHYKEGLRNSQ